MKITKKSVGLKVWLVPTGNNVKRNNSSSLSQAKEVVITKMARVKGEFTEVGRDYSESFSTSDYSDSAIRQGDNAGYEIYACFEDVKKAEKATEIRHYLRVNWNSMSDDDLLRVGSVLSLELTN